MYIDFKPEYHLRTCERQGSLRGQIGSLSLEGMAFLPAATPAGIVIVCFLPNLQTTSLKGQNVCTNRSETWSVDHIGLDKNYGKVRLGLRGHLKAKKTIQ